MFKDNLRDKIVRTAKRYIGVKYRYGGTTPFGFDCSGFVMYVYKKNGIPLPREARGQFYKGRRISIRNAGPGDLIFFTTGRRRISHVGIYIGGGKFIHSPSSGKRVRTASIQNRYWKKRYIGIVSLFQRANSRRFYSKNLQND